MAEPDNSNAPSDSGDNNGDASDPFAAVVSNPIGKIALCLLKDYIYKGLDKRHISNVPNLDGIEKESKLTPEELNTCKSIGLQLAKIGDTVQNDESLQSVGFPYKFDTIGYELYKAGMNQRGPLASPKT